MKIQMNIPYRKAWLVIVGAVLLLTMFTSLAIFALVEKRYGAVLFFGLFDLLIFAGVYFRFRYGMTITEKRVVLIEQAGIKILPYEDGASITVKFTNESVSACVKMKNQKSHVFVWHHIFLGTQAVLPSKNYAKIDRDFVEKSILQLLQCPKVEIQNFYSQKS